MVVNSIMYSHIWNSSDGGALWSHIPHLGMQPKLRTKINRCSPSLHHSYLWLTPLYPVFLSFSLLTYLGKKNEQETENEQHKFFLATKAVSEGRENQPCRGKPFQSRKQSDHVWGLVWIWYQTRAKEWRPPKLERTSASVSSDHQMEEKNEMWNVQDMQCGIIWTWFEMF